MKVKSETLGRNTSQVELVTLSVHGLWLLVKDKEYFLPFESYPWFKNADQTQIAAVSLLHGTHLYWPELDVDLSLDILEAPSQFPLIAQ